MEVSLHGVNVLVTPQLEKDSCARFARAPGVSHSLYSKGLIVFTSIELQSPAGHGTKFKYGKNA